MPPSRRALLGGGAAVVLGVGVDLLVGHGHGRRRPTVQGTSPTPAAADPLAAAAATDERSIIAAYDAAVRAHPELAATLDVPLAHHRAHLAALTRGPAPAAVAVPTGSVPVPPDAAVFQARRSALLALRGREAALSAARSRQVVGDLTGGALLASIAAADAVHVDLLDAAAAALPAPLPPPAPTTTAPRPTTTSPSPTPTPAPTSTRATTPPRRTPPPSTTSRRPTPTRTPTPTPTPTTTSPGPL